MEQHIANAQRQIGAFNPTAAEFVRENHHLFATGLAGLITAAALFAPGVCGDTSIAGALAGK